MGIPVAVAVVGKPDRVYDEEFLKVYPAFFSSFLHQLKIDDGKARLVLYFMYKASKLPMNSDSMVNVPTKELMEAIGVSKPTILKYINELLELCIITRRYPRLPLYQVDPTLFYRGNLEAFFQRHGDDIR